MRADVGSVHDLLDFLESLLFKYSDSQFIIFTKEPRAQSPKLLAEQIDGHQVTGLNLFCMPTPELLSNERAPKVRRSPPGKPLDSSSCCSPSH
jgi:hypothetical protein